MKTKQHRTLTLADVKQAVAEYETSLHDGQHDGHAADATAFLATKFGRNERHAARYLAASKLPQALQDAVESGTLPLSMAEQVAHLNSVTQAKIAEQVAAGADAKVVAQQHLMPKAVNPIKVFGVVIRTLRKGVPVLRAKLNKIVGCTNAEDVETLDATASLLVELRQQLAATHAERQAQQAKRATSLEQLGTKLDTYAQVRDQVQSDGTDVLAVDGVDSRRNSID